MPVRSNLFTTIGMLCVLLCIVLLGYWKIAIGVAGIALMIAGWFALEADDDDEATDGA